jgi:hypothetical protein
MRENTVMSADAICDFLPLGILLDAPEETVFQKMMGHNRTSDFGSAVSGIGRKANVDLADGIVRQLAKKRHCASAILRYRSLDTASIVLL